LNQDDFRKLISGQREGLWPSILRFLLLLVSMVYSAIIRTRNFLYNQGWLKRHHVEAAVISIGNITTGGTGKTPFVIWVYNFLREKNIACAILTRGYKTKKGQLSDEPAILAKSCPGAKLIVNPDRAAGAAKAVSQFGCKAIVMDDGFQHRRLARDIDIVTIDATCPFGYGRSLPAGLLREPVSALKRAQAVVITRCDQIEETQLAELENKLRLVNSEMVIARSIHTPVFAKYLANKELNLEELKGKNIFAFCGIGNPDAFLNTIKKAGLNLVGSKIYNDHHNYTIGDIDDIYEQALYLKADLVLSTQKDWTKTILAATGKKDILFAYLAIEMKFTAGQSELKQLIEETLAGKS